MLSCPSLTPALVEARSLSRSSPSSGQLLLAPTDFSLFAGERIAVCGTSGSGKSVFLRLLALLDAPSSGEIRWQGNPLAPQSIPQYRSCVCYLAQRPAMVEGTVLDNLQLPFTLKALRHRTFDRNAVANLLEQAGKTEGFLAKPAMDLSGGEAQIVALIRVLLIAPQVILFDEPTAALDPHSAVAVQALVSNWFNASTSTRAYVWVSHDREQSQRMSTRQLDMQHGVLIAETSR